MNATAKLEELISCAGILTKGLWPDPIGPDGFPLLST